MPRKNLPNKQVPAKLGAKLLSSVPFESGFHFFTAFGNFTGMTAISLVEFTAKLQIVPAESVQFHFEHKDFQKWIKGTIEDQKLAERINEIVHDGSSEKLRKDMLEIAQKRITELRRLSQ